jgi:hypothetical protein
MANVFKMERSLSVNAIPVSQMTGLYDSVRDVKTLSLSTQKIVGMLVLGL